MKTTALVIRFAFAIMLGLPMVSVAIAQEQEETWDSNNLILSLELGRGAASEMIWLNDQDLVVVTDEKLWRYHYDEEFTLTASIDFPDGWWWTSASNSSYFALFLPNNEHTSSKFLLYDLNLFEFATEIVIPNHIITTATFVPNSTKFIFSDTTHQLWQFDWQSNEMQLLDTGFNQPAIYHIVVSPDGHYAVTGGEASNEISIWNLDNFQLDHTMQIDDPDVLYSISGLEFSPDGRFLSILRGTQITNLLLLDVESREWLAITPVRIPDNISFNQTGDFMAGMAGNSILLWHLPDFGKVLEINTQLRATAIALSPTGQYLAISDYQQLYLLETSTGQTIAQIAEHYSPPSDISFSPDSAQLAALYNDGSIRIWDSTNGELLKHFSLPTPAHGQITFSPNGRMLAVSTGYRASFVYVLDADSGSVIQTFTQDSSYDIAFTHDNSFIVVADWGIFNVWDIETGTRIFAQEYTRGSVAFAQNPRGDLLAATFAGVGSPLIMFNSSTWEGLAAFGFFTVGGASSAAISSDNRLLASSHCDVIAFWNITTNIDITKLDSYSEPEFKLATPENCLEQLEFFANDTILIGSNNSSVLFWDMRNHELVDTRKGRRFALAANDQQIAIIDGSSIQIWNLSYV